MNNITLDHVYKRYGDAEVIHGVDLAINSGEFVVFVGPSGCGKSTLLRMIAGLEEISDGTLSIGDKIVNDVPASDRGLAMVFQSYALYPHMTVAQNLTFGLRMNGADKADIAARLQHSAEILQIDHLLDRKPKALSGGQRQRVAIGRAIIRDSGILLFDEPLSNLDAELRVQMRVEIARLHKRLDVTMIYVTHDQTEAMTLADKIVVLRDGRIEQQGAPLELYDNPDNQFVGGFIGSPKMNFLPVKVVSAESGRAQVALCSFNDSLVEVALQSTVPAGTSMILGIRPEHCLPAGRGGSRLSLRADVSEHLGTTNYIYAHTSTDSRFIVQQDDDARNIAAGDTFEIDILASRAFLFTPEGSRVR